MHELIQTYWPYILLIIVVFWSAFLIFLFLKRKNLLRRKTRSTGESKSAIVRGIDIHYQEVGDGPPVLYLHGIGASHYTWRFLVPLLSRKHKMILIDLPGFGLSSKNTKHDYSIDGQAEILHEFLKTLDIKQARIVGSSMGGLLALWMAKRWPDSYLQVVSISPPLNPKVLPFQLSLWSRVARPLSLAINEQVVRQILKRVIYRQELITDDVVYKYTEPYLDSGKSIQTFMLSTKTVSDPRVPDELSQIKGQVLFLWGEKDKIIPVSSAKIGTSNIPNSFLATHPDAGHHPMEDQPEWVADKITEFFDV